ncbi:DUF1003 domain-containing protein [Agaribacter flavus]|uniref:DUF1003 domain-containing protein n=1 Tax=Agaribacter flavus TaxID=1902781 RepID=A0ABV7FU72_9ALTE
MKKYFENLAKSLFRSKFVDLDETEQHVIECIANQAPIATNLNESFKEQLSFGQRMADKVAEFGGSWTFIIIFVCIMASWMAVNVYFLAAEAFDPYPFILLNLMLSTLAALQAPIIMMSQNRQAEKDRMAAALNYEVSLKTDLEILRLHQKLDALIAQQGSREPVAHD